VFLSVTVPRTKEYLHLLAFMHPVVSGKKLAGMTWGPFSQQNYVGVAL
jgi:hypothetical protein